MPDEELKTADEWLQHSDFKHVCLMDPDGWDRKNFDESWAEKITRSEFEERLMHSTVIYDASKRGEKS